MTDSAMDTPKAYKIYVAEALSSDWQKTFTNLAIRHRDGGTCITVICRDQSELHGVIRMGFNMGLTLHAVVEEGYFID
ncbi:hypothetical protein ACXJY6_07830 [Vibrio sp. RC27]